MRRKGVLALLCCVLAAGFLTKPAAGGTPCVDDSLENDDTIAQATELDASAGITATSCAADASDIFRVFLPENSSYIFKATPEPGFDVLIEWLNDDGSLLFTFDSGTEGAIEQHPSGFAVEYEVFYRIRGAAGDEGSYTVSVTGSPGSTGLAAPLEIDALDTPVTDDLNWLSPTTGSNQLGTGWRLSENANTDNFPGANGEYAVGDGSSAVADVYSFGTTAQSDRAFGTLGAGVGTGSTGLHAVLQLVLRNDTGSTIGSLSVSYTGEQWRLGATTGTDTLDFGHRIEFGSTFAAHDPLDFTTPNNGASAGALDGNALENRTAVSSTISGLEIAPGQYYLLRWLDADIEGAEDGLAVDDLSITAHAPPPDEDDDGVPDGSDLCPGTVSGHSVDPDGCSDSQLDDDDDDVSNAEDACPNSPVDDVVGPDGCAWDLAVTILKGKGTVTSGDPLVINCGLGNTDCTERYPSGTSVTLSAKPKRGWRFVKWGIGGSACPGSKSKTCIVFIDSDETAQAIFKKR